LFDLLTDWNTYLEHRKSADFRCEDPGAERAGSRLRPQARPRRKKTRKTPGKELKWEPVRPEHDDARLEMHTPWTGRTSVRQSERDGRAEWASEARCGLRNGMALSHHPVLDF